MSFAYDVLVPKAKRAFRWTGVGRGKSTWSRAELSVVEDMPALCTVSLRHLVGAGPPDPAGAMNHIRSWRGLTTVVDELVRTRLAIVARPAQSPRRMETGLAGSRRATYTLRAINRSEDLLGFYVNPPGTASAPPNVAAAGGPGPDHR